MKDSVIKNILVNIRAFFHVNVNKRINENLNKIIALEEELDRQKIVSNVLFYFLHHPELAKAYSSELDYLYNTGNFCNFPYPSDPCPNDVVSGFDPDCQLPFVVHQSKRLYFPSTFSSDDAVKAYLNYIRVEKLLGIGERVDAPHQYQSPGFQVSEGDVVFDIGAAEGLFALDQIDKASRVVVVESDPLWMKALKHTFAVYCNKVTIIDKFVSSSDTETSISLGKLLSDFDYDSAFVKMDIEGYELPSITEAMEVLRQKKNTKLAVASYHKENDAEKLKSIFDQLGYDSEFSGGYMLFSMYGTPLPPYFRKGIVRAKHKG